MQENKLGVLDKGDRTVGVKLRTPKAGEGGLCVLERSQPLKKKKKVARER